MGYKDGGHAEFFCAIFGKSLQLLGRDGIQG